MSQSVAAPSRAVRVGIAVAASVAVAVPVSAAAATRSSAHIRPAGGPSGIAMPTGAPRGGWRQVLADDFGGDRLDGRWAAYAGPIGGGEGGWWASSHAVVRDGQLVLRTYRDQAACADPASCTLFGDEVSGGVKSRLALRYGRVMVRARVTPVADVSFLGILWPASDQAPPETDFIEAGGPTHLTAIGATVKYAPAAATVTTSTSVPAGSTGATGAAGTAAVIDSTVAADASRWHTYGVTWSPGKIVYTLDGRVWGTVRSPYVASVPMNIVLQSQTVCEAAPGLQCTTPWLATEPSVHIAWVVAYARTR